MASPVDRLASDTSQPVAANHNAASVFHSNSHATVTDNQTESTVLPPFSENLTLDKELNLSHNDFKQSINQFYTNKQISAIDQLKTTPPYPTPHMLAHFAKMVYADYKHGYPEPPDGWQLLTTASNCGIQNGYYGTAYWHPENQQVVIAHRGTLISRNVATTIADVYTDLIGVVFNCYVQQMSSASTFANKVVTVLQEIEQEMKVSFELFFTGHSLGGWLAQITTFTTQYLEVRNGKFLKKLKTQPEQQYTSSSVQDSYKVTHNYHPHTAVFDSPGCKKMLSQMADKLDVRYKGRSVDLQHLDITSYLAVPNRINTCNSHVGTVYRIFTDLSDMGYFCRNTPLYNITSHEMDRILKAFDTETGQVGKDDKGEPKIREVVDWPVSAGITGGAEWKAFFKSADQLNLLNEELNHFEHFLAFFGAHPMPHVRRRRDNNYHPEELNLSNSKVSKGYSLIRYQTKAYDECTISLSTFTLDEREFLERYRWLRQVPEFFKPENLFGVMNNAEEKENAQQKLQNFELDNGSVRCPNASTLHNLIPYVKRLIKLFPCIKEILQEQFPLLKIRDRVYQHETKCYVEKIDQSALDFNPGALDVREFLDSDQQIWLLRMTDGDAWTGIMKVYRVLQNTPLMPRYFSKGCYTVLDLERLLTVNRMINLNALLASMETPYLLMIACETNQPVNDELESMFKELFNILKQNKTVKSILATQSEGSTSAILQQIASKTLDKGSKTTDEKLTWNELTTNSQIKLLEKTVIFQGRRVALNQITSAEAMPDSFPIAHLLQETEITIGKESVSSASIDCNEKYYIARTFIHNIVIKQDILSNKNKGKCVDLLASTQQIFKLLCQQNANKNVHWLVEERQGELVWQQSKGDLKVLRKYIDAQKPRSYAPSHLEKLLQQARTRRLMLISEKAGMGKSTLLTHLYKQIKEKHPASWLVRINLNDYTEGLEAQTGKNMDKAWVLEFLSKDVLKLESNLEKHLFMKCFEGDEISKVVVMVDGVDEISPNYKDTVIKMLQILKQTSLEQLWVTTRPHLREELEDKLQQLSYTLQPFSEIEQVDYLKKFWLQTLNLEDMNQQKLQVFADCLIKKLSQSISDKDNVFTGVPLQTHMLAKAFEKEFRSFYLSEKSEPELLHMLDLVALYRRFIDSIYDIYHVEKSKTPTGNMVVREQRERDLKNIELEHQLLALEALFTEDQVECLQSYTFSRFSDDEIGRIGIVQRNNEGKLQFNHRTFAEYFVAEFLINQLLEKRIKHTQVEELLLNNVLIQPECQVIRSFLNGLLEKHTPSEEVLKEYGGKIEHWNKRADGSLKPPPLHQAAIEDNTHIIGFLLDSLKAGELSNSLTDNLLAGDHWGQTAWHMAADNNSVQALKKIWEWAEEVAPTLTYNLLLSQDTNSRTAWQLAAEGGHTEIVAKLWDWAKEELSSPDLLKNKLLLSQDMHGVNAWHLAAKTGNAEVLGKLWNWAKELHLRPEELRNGVFLSKDKFGQTVWHMAAEGGQIEVLEKLWDWAKVEKIKPHRLKNVLFLMKQSGGFNTWCLAVNSGHIHVLEKLWGWAEELELTENEFSELFLAADVDGNNAMCLAAWTDSVELLDKLWAVCKKMQLNSKDLSKFLVAAWHKAAAKGYLEILERLWLWVGDVYPLKHDLRRRLLLGQNKDGESTWHMAAAGGHTELLEKLWDWAEKQELRRDNLKSILFLPGDSFSFNTWGYALHKARRDVLQKLWGWAKELKLTPEEITNNLFLAVCRDGKSAFYWAACTGHIEVLEILWSLSKEITLNPDDWSKLLIAAGYVAVVEGYLDLLERLCLWAGEVQRNPHDFKSMLLLGHNKDGENTWHMAAAGGHIEVLNKLWGWAEEAQINADDLRSGMLIARDKHGNTAWQLAVRDGRTMVLEKILDLTKEIQRNPAEIRNTLLLNEENDGRPAWFLAAKNGNLKLLEELWIWAKEKGNTEEIKSLLLAQNQDGDITFHVAAEYSVVVLKELWDFAKEAQLNHDELQNKLLLAKDNFGYTAWHRAAKGGSLEALETLWSWAKEVELNCNERKNKWFLAGIEEGESAWHLAAQGNDEGILQKLWSLAKELQVNAEELKNKLLRVTDKSGNNMWHRAAEKSSLKTLETLWSWVKKAELHPADFLLAQNKSGETAFHMAAHGDQEQMLQKLWSWAKEEARQKSNMIKKELLLVVDNYGNTAFHLAALKGRLEALETLWSLAKEAAQYRKVLLLAQNKRKETAFHMAAHGNHIQVLEKLWVCGNEARLPPTELKNKLFLAKDEHENTAWHIAGLEGSLEILHTLWSMAKEAELELDNLLVGQNVNGETAFHLAAQEGQVDILQKMWLWTEEQLKTSELKNNLLLGNDKYGYTAWHRAALKGSVETLQTLWGLAKKSELNLDYVLLARNGNGETAFHMAAHDDHVEILHKLWVWSEETQLTPNELKIKLLKATDKYGYIAWHRAAENGSLETLKTLCMMAKEVALNPSDLLLAQTFNGETAFQMAAKKCDEEMLQGMWDWAEEAQLNTNELKKECY